MEATTETPPEAPTEQPVAAAPEDSPRLLAELEAENAERARRLIQKRNDEAARAAEQPISIMGLAAQGREALAEGMRRHRERTKPIETPPPPMTERQMTATQLEIEAGRRTQARHAAQQAHRPVPKKDPNEGFTTPVYRPGDVVPDPTLPAISGPGGLSAAGTRKYGPDAP
jgi:hypothetical protein